jgi:hypothetical protein
MMLTSKFLPMNKRMRLENKRKEAVQAASAFMLLKELDILSKTESRTIMARIMKDYRAELMGIVNASKDEATEDMPAEGVKDTSPS